jgi:two-component sensor histidine kinase
MTAPVFSLTPRPAAVLARLQAFPGARYWAAAVLVLLALVVRLTVSSAMGNGYGYTCFYPAVILAAYWLGARPALLATGLSTVIVYAFLGPVPLHWNLDGRGLVALTFFLVSSLLLIHILSTIRAQFALLAATHARVEALATGQAELFHEHAQRTTDHLQLISAILQLRAREEADPMVSRVLTNAASRTLLISRAHREFAGNPDSRIPFDAFARKLVQASAARGGLPADKVRIAGGDLDVPLEHATALGLVLLEYLTTLRACPSATTLAVILADDGDQRTLNLVATGDRDVVPPRDIPLFEAVSEQLGGELLITRGATGCGVRISFPATIQPTEAWEPVALSLH